MDLVPLLSAILVTTAVFSWVNHRFLRLPPPIGVMLVALAMSLGLFVLDALGFEVRAAARNVETQLDFKAALMDGMLAFLLFAGALHVDLKSLLGQGRVVALLATVGVVVTTFLVGGLSWVTLGALGVPVPFGPCLLFGALISPTDPIAVLAILKSADAPKSLETKITGESLFNDGVGVVVFTVVLGAVVGGHGAHGGEGGVGAIAQLFALEVLGGVGIGLAGGFLAWWMLRSIENAQVELLITLALAAGVYALAASVHASGPLAVVVAGLWIGNTGASWAETHDTHDLVHEVWTVVDEVLNAVLFVLIGLEVLLLDLDGALLLAGAIAVPLVLLARFVSVGGTIQLMKRRRSFTPFAVRILTWGGLRGGISVALALAIPATLPERSAIVTITYVVVVFSILVQGLTVGRLIRMIPRGTASDAA
jgi:CPA1 family monovalent cation:H+ antiporter